MSSEIVISVRGVSKCFNTYDRPQDRLKQTFFSILSRLSPQGPGRERMQARAEACGRSFWALSDIDLEVRKGETVGIIGRNGSGKSTLLQIICGTLNPTQGEVEVKGRVAALLELGSGFDAEYTGRENVFMNGQLLGLSKQQISERFAAIEAFADIGDFIDQPVKAYSSGMYVRLAFAVIAHVDADVLVVDEALAVGDAFFTQKCMRFLRQFMKTGTILFVSHDTASIKNLCTDAVWIEKGAVLESGTPKSVCDMYLQAFYEEQQGKSTTTRLNVEPRKVLGPRRDARQDLINASNLRNDLQIFEFDSEAGSLGSGGARIVDVAICNDAGEQLSWIVGGEDVRLMIKIDALVDLRSPIVGFYIKDKLGQTLFGDNTYLSYENLPLACSAGEQFDASFSFAMPRLQRGEYSINVAVADGTQDEHVQLHWIHDALIFKSESTSVSSGILGIPMQSISLSKM
ncbi:ABC transporter ATP-binding protein [Herbaspirillum sp. RTI4]|uniref:ABC transporter ATP-binding protein n=1 Tax=Herbaspirillum sp. RTI4 TaxID=3048640 RepID=UPI002AB4A53F|nr:ABC transporter ATP-binding protein [Herbaspirillum sp. RTI4]MDY7577606.1 ABC transporter ATP-binding protein [Herbaspirillum sp. RTI4]MEA9983277.1 ABC transporter ATP-binding protein [Herbaspirillum sp. RTI4]